MIRSILFLLKRYILRYLQNPTDIIHFFRSVSSFIYNVSDPDLDPGRVITPELLAMTRGPVDTKQSVEEDWTGICVSISQCTDASINA